MATTSIPNQVRIWLSQHPGFHTTREIAENLDLETKAVSSAVSKLVKAERIVREDGKVADPLLAEAEEASSNWENQTDPGAPNWEQDAHEAETQAQYEDVQAGEEGYPAAHDEAIEETLDAMEEDLLDELSSVAKKFDIASMKDKIAKLLAKAERTDNEKERDAYNEQAERLMLKLGIQKAELEAAGEVKPEEIVEVTRDWTGNYSIVMVPFVANVATGFGNLTTLQRTVSAMLRKTYVIGHKTDVEEFHTLIDSLALQVMSALRRWQKDHREERKYLTDMEKYVQHRSFISGFGMEVRDRLLAEREEEEQEASTGAALVLASKQDRVDAWMQEQYGELKNARGGMRQRSSRAMIDGMVAGKSANLGSDAVGRRGELS